MAWNMAHVLISISHSLIWNSCLHWFLLLFIWVAYYHLSQCIQWLSMARCWLHCKRCDVNLQSQYEKPTREVNLIRSSTPKLGLSESSINVCWFRCLYHSSGELYDHTSFIVSPSRESITLWTDLMWLQPSSSHRSYLCIIVCKFVHVFIRALCKLYYLIPSHN